MALVLSGERPAAAASPLNPLRMVANWFAQLRAERYQRVALKSLLDLDPHRLRDLGIERSDLFDALHVERRPTKLLAERRSGRLGDALNP
jgi:uncharacterized protein YjiS (DUF1127 family)